MKSSSSKKLVRYAALMNLKYAVDANSIKDQVKNTLQAAIANASTGQMGIMPFIKMLKEDGANLNINVTRSGDTITVSAPNLTNPALAPKYNALSEQIKKYLTRYIDVFPTVVNGSKVSYDNLTVTLTYLGDNGGQIATLPQ